MKKSHSEFLVFCNMIWGLCPFSEFENSILNIDELVSNNTYATLKVT